MKLINFIEKRSRWLQIQGLPIILSVGYLTFFFFFLSEIVPFQNITLYGDAIKLNNEYWRLFLFIFTINYVPIFIIFTVYLQWVFGSALENDLGARKLTLFFITNWCIAIFFSLVLPEVHFTDSFHVCVFLAFALLFPDFILRLFFVIPIKIKWLALITYLWIVYKIIDERSLTSIAHALTIILPIALFFGKAIYYKVRYKTRKTMLSAKVQIMAKNHRHKCSICQITDILDPKQEFRYLEDKGQMSCFCDQHVPSKSTL